MKFNGKICLVVIGGRGDCGEEHEYMWKSVEVLDLSSGNGWIFGPDLPIKQFCYQQNSYTMVTSPTGSVIVIVKAGTFAGTKPSRLLWELSGDSLDSLKWTVLDQKLYFKRQNHVSIPMTMESYNDFMGKLNLEKITVQRINNENDIHEDKRKSNNQLIEGSNKRIRTTQDKKPCWYRYNCRKDNCTCTVPFGNRPNTYLKLEFFSRFSSWRC